MFFREKPTQGDSGWKNSWLTFLRHPVLLIELYAPMFREPYRPRSIFPYIKHTLLSRSLRDLCVERWTFQPETDH